MMGHFYPVPPEKPKKDTLENKEPIKQTLDLTWLITDIDKSIQEIELSDIDLIDSERAARYISMLKYQRKLWIDNVLYDKSYNLVKKSIIVDNVVDIQMDFTKYLINSMPKEKIQKIKGEQLIQIFNTLLNKEHIDEKDFKSTIDKMSELEEHYRSNMSFYDDISDKITAIIYEKIKRYARNYNRDLDTFYSEDYKVINIIKKDILKEAKEITLNKYEDNNKIEYQNEIRMFLTLNNLSNPKKIYELSELILLFHKDETLEIDTTIIKDNKTYANLLKDIDSIKSKDHSLYTFFIVQLYYIKQESIDNNAFFNEVNELKDIFHTYLTRSSPQDDQLFNAVDRVTEYQGKTSIPTKTIINSIELKEKHYDYVKKYNDYLTYYSRMINENVRGASLYSDYKEEILMLANFITSDMIGPSLDDDIPHTNVKDEILKLLNCDYDQTTLWKLNSYIKLYLGKPPSYLNLYELNNDGFSVQSKLLTNQEYHTINKLVSNFLSEMILIEPFYYKEKFEKIFNEKLDKLKNELYTNYNVSLNMSMTRYYKTSLSHKSIESPLKSPVNLKK